MSETVAVIDCTNDYSFQKVWGVSLCERILRRLSDEGVRVAYLLVNPNQVIRFRRDFKPRFDVETRPVTADALGDVSLPANAQVLILDGHAAYDNRLIRDILPHDGPLRISNNQGDSPLLVKMSFEQFRAYVLKDADGQTWQERLSRGGSGIPSKSTNDYSTYDKILKSNTTPLLRRASSQQELKALERYVSRSQSKVVLDFVAILLDKMFTWILVKPLSKTWITPNMLTWVIIVIQVVVVPVFFLRWITTGLILEWIMITLDSCDGKLARLTIRQSEKLGWIEHRTSYLSTSLWYAAIGLHLGDYEFASLYSLGGILMLVMFWVDRKTVLAFVRTLGKSIYSYSTLDIRISYIIARRNISIFILTVAMLAGHLEVGFVACVIWTVAGWLFHLSRLMLQSAREGTRITMKKAA